MQPSLDFPPAAFFFASLAIILINRQVVFPRGRELRQDSCEALVPSLTVPVRTWEALMAPAGDAIVGWRALPCSPSAPNPKREGRRKHHHQFPSGGFQGCCSALPFLSPCNQLIREQPWGCPFSGVILFVCASCSVLFFVLFCFSLPSALGDGVPACQGDPSQGPQVQKCFL